MCKINTDKGPFRGRDTCNYCLHQGCPNYGPRSKHGPSSDAIWPACLIFGPPAQALNTTQHAIPIFNPWGQHRVTDVCRLFQNLEKKKIE